MIAPLSTIGSFIILAFAAGCIAELFDHYGDRIVAALKGKGQ